MKPKNSSRRQILVIFLSLSTTLFSCREKTSRQTDTLLKGSYGFDADFLKKHLSHVTELANTEGARVLVTGDYQGRVMTSSADGDMGNSFGWINYDLIESGELLSQFNPTGGEERFWIGPEGGQYSFYFKKDDPFEFKNWKVPAFIDTVKYTAISSGKEEVIFSHRANVENYQGFRFDLEVTRTIRLLSASQLSEKMGQTVPRKVKWVAYETENTVKNTGQTGWNKETGLMSVWLLGMFNPSDETVAIIPFKNQPEAGKHITDDYFGIIPEGRLVRRDSVLLLKCDGRHRSKLGLSPAIAKPLAGSFDYEKNILTLILFSVDSHGDYVNSKWEVQQEPYAGDVVNAYNDGPLEEGGQLGPFFELESSSPAQPLQPGEHFTYKQVTCHFEGDFASLDALTEALLGISLRDARMP